MNSAIKTTVVSVLVVFMLIVLLKWKPADHTTQPDEESLLMFCAAGIKPRVESVANEYREVYGVSIELQYGGSGTLLSNVKVARRGDRWSFRNQQRRSSASANGPLRRFFSIPNGGVDLESNPFAAANTMRTLLPPTERFSKSGSRRIEAELLTNVSANGDFDTSTR